MKLRAGISSSYTWQRDLKNWTTFALCWAAKNLYPGYPVTHSLVHWLYYSSSSTLILSYRVILDGNSVRRVDSAPSVARKRPQAHSTPGEAVAERCGACEAQYHTWNYSSSSPYVWLLNSSWSEPCGLPEMDRGSILSVVSFCENSQYFVTGLAR